MSLPDECEVWGEEIEHGPVAIAKRASLAIQDEVAGAGLADGEEQLHHVVDAEHVPRKRDGIVGLVRDPQDVERSTIVGPGKGGHGWRIRQVTYCTQTIRAGSSDLV